MIIDHEGDHAVRALTVDRDALNICSKGDLALGRIAAGHDEGPALRRQGTLIAKRTRRCRPNRVFALLKKVEAHKRQPAIFGGQGFETFRVPEVAFLRAGVQRSLTRFSRCAARKT